jgi:hypothetical protein
MATKLNEIIKYKKEEFLFRKSQTDETSKILGD